MQYDFHEERRSLRRRAGRQHDPDPEVDQRKQLDRPRQWKDRRRLPRHYKARLLAFDAPSFMSRQVGERIESFETD